LGFSKFWRTSVHRIISKVKGKFDLGWLRVTMSYHRFNNLRETFQGDLSKKLTDNIVSLDFKNLPCNCQSSSKGENGLCIYEGACRKSIVVYKTTCLQTGKVYIGNTQQHLKKRMQQHFQDVRKLVLTEQRSDSFASHFADFFDPPRNPRERLKIRDQLEIKVEVIWQGRPLSVVKTFGTKGCALCSKERIEILKIARNNPELAINSCQEVYGWCRHKPRFHRYPASQKPSTDDPAPPGERVANSQGSVVSLSSSNESSSIDIESYIGIAPSDSGLSSGDSPTASAVGEKMQSPASDTVDEPRFMFGEDFGFESDTTRKRDRL
jgi:hypothetical protein